MKITSIVAMAAATVINACAVGLTANSQPVQVYVSGGQADIGTRFAEGQASEMFARIGVKIEWRDLGRVAPPSDAIVIDMVSSGEAECPGALACAKPYEGVHIRVFRHRLEALVPERALPFLLAHVLVHEMTHILEGVNRHSRSGVMKARWDSQDLNQMSRRPLQFTDIDVQLIRMGMTERNAKLLAAVRVER